LSSPELRRCTLRRKKMETTEWHVTLRGAKRLFLFRDDEDYRTYYGILGVASKKYGISMVSHCLMSNHLHLNPRSDSERLSALMYQSGKNFARYHNRKYRMAGHVFEGPYYADPVTHPFFLHRVTRYIHLNPVRAGKATRPEMYPWSSCNLYFTGEPGPFFTDFGSVLKDFGGDLGSARKSYRRFVEQDLVRRVDPSPSKYTASELWQEQYRWLAEYAEERRSLLAPMDPTRVAAYWAHRIGIPPRSVARARGLTKGQEVSREIEAFSRLLSRHPDWAARLESAGMPG